MQIFGIDISSKNFGLDQIYIRCMAGLSVLAGIILPTYSSLANMGSIEFSKGGVVGGSGIISGYYYRAVVGARGVTADVLNYYPDRSTAPYECSSGCCFVDGSTTNIGCPAYDSDPWHRGILVAGYCYVDSSGVCGSAGGAGTGGTGCYPYFYAPRSVMEGLGCKSGNITVSGKVILNKCYYEAVDMESVVYDSSCNTASPNNKLPHSGYYIPYTPMHRLVEESWTNFAGADADNYIGRFILIDGPRWISGAMGVLERDYATYDVDNLDNYCTYGGCPAIWLTDANGGYKVVEAAYNSPNRNQYGTATWGGTPPNCTATLTSTKADGTSSDPAGTWTISCKYSE